MKKKKILLLVPSLGIGGREKIALTIADFLSKKYDVQIITFYSREVEYKTSHKIINLNIQYSKSIIKKVLNQLKRAFKLRKIRKQNQPLLVLSFGEAANITNCLSRGKNKGKTICSIHGFAEVKKSFLLNFILKKSDKIIAISKDMAYNLKKIYPKFRNIIVIENGYDIEIITRKSNEKSNPINGNPVFVTMGRLEKVKGIDRVIKAFAIVRQELRNAKLVIIGNGSLMLELKELVKDLKIADSVLFFGFQENPYKILKKCDIYVLGSRNEGFPNAIIEALSCGLTVISLDCLSGPKEILSKEFSEERVKGIRFEEYGVIVENYSDEEMLVKELATAMIKVYNNKENLEYQINAPIRAEDYSIKVFENRIIELIKSFE